MNKVKKIINTDGFANFASSVVAIAVGLLVGFIILLISNPSQAVPAFFTVLRGGFVSASSTGQVIYYAVPIIMTGLSIGFAFKTGLFNIGAAGQFIVGSFTAVYVGINFTFLGPFTWVLAILLAMVAGGLWGLIPGALKAYANVNEVISSIMMNYMGMHLVNYLVKTFIFDDIRNQSLEVPASSNIPKLGLDKLFDNISVNGGVFVVLLAVLVIYIILNKTTMGFELKACGLNPDAARYAGVNSKRKIINSMVIAGALSGLGGALLFLSGAGKNIQVLDILAPEGFNGIPVALLGLSNPIGVLFSGVFIANLNVGGQNLQSFDFVPEIIDIIIASIIYFSAFSLIFKFVKKIVGNNKNANDDEPLTPKLTENQIELQTGSSDDNENVISTENSDTLVDNIQANDEEQGGTV